MKKVTWLLALFSTATLLITIAEGMSLLKGRSDPMSHLYWALATLVILLFNNLMAVMHVSRGERLILALRARLKEYEGKGLEAEL